MSINVDVSKCYVETLHSIINVKSERKLS